jgi:hypothetical protein
MSGGVILDAKTMRIAWPLGILLGIALTVLVFGVLAGVLEGLGISPADYSDLHAFALVVLVMLSLILLRQSAPSRPNRIIRPRSPASQAPKPAAQGSEARYAGRRSPEEAGK